MDLHALFQTEFDKAFSGMKAPPPRHLAVFGQDLVEEMTARSTKALKRALDTNKAPEAAPPLPRHLAVFGQGLVEEMTAEIMDSMNRARDTSTSPRVVPVSIPPPPPDRPRGAEGGVVTVLKARIDEDELEEKIREREDKTARRTRQCKRNRVGDVPDSGFADLPLYGNLWEATSRWLVSFKFPETDVADISRSGARTHEDVIRDLRRDGYVIDRAPMEQVASEMFEYWPNESPVIEVKYDEHCVPTFTSRGRAAWPQCARRHECVLRRIPPPVLPGADTALFTARAYLLTHEWRGLLEGRPLPPEVAQRPCRMCMRELTAKAADFLVFHPELGEGKCWQGVAERDFEKYVENVMMIPTSSSFVVPIVVSHCANGITTQLFAPDHDFGFGAFAVRYVDESPAFKASNLPPGVIRPGTQDEDLDFDAETAGLPRAEMWLPYAEYVDRVRRNVTSQHILGKSFLRRVAREKAPSLEALRIVVDGGPEAIWFKQSAAVLVSKMTGLPLSEGNVFFRIASMVLPVILGDDAKFASLVSLFPCPNKSSAASLTTSVEARISRHEDSLLSGLPAPLLRTLSSFVAGEEALSGDAPQRNAMNYVNPITFLRAFLKRVTRRTGRWDENGPLSDAWMWTHGVARCPVLTRIAMLCDLQCAARLTGRPLLPWFWMDDEGCEVKRLEQVIAQLETEEPALWSELAAPVNEPSALQTAMSHALSNTERILVSQGASDACRLHIARKQLMRIHATLSRNDRLRPPARRARATAAAEDADEEEEEEEEEEGDDDDDFIGIGARHNTRGLVSSGYERPTIEEIREQTAHLRVVILPYDIREAGLFARSLNLSSSTSAHDVRHVVPHEVFVQFCRRCDEATGNKLAADSEMLKSTSVTRAHNVVSRDNVYPLPADPAARSQAHHFSNDQVSTSAIVSRPGIPDAHVTADEFALRQTRAYRGWSALHVQVCPGRSSGGAGSKGTRREHEEDVPLIEFLAVGAITWSTRSEVHRRGGYTICTTPGCGLIARLSMGVVSWAGTGPICHVCVIIGLRDLASQIVFRVPVYMREAREPRLVQQQQQPQQQQKEEEKSAEEFPYTCTEGHRAILVDYLLQEATLRGRDDPVPCPLRGCKGKMIPYEEVVEEEEQPRLEQKEEKTQKGRDLFPVSRRSGAGPQALVCNIFSTVCRPPLVMMHALRQDADGKLCVVPRVMCGMHHRLCTKWEDNKVQLRRTLLNPDGEKDLFNFLYKISKENAELRKERAINGMGNVYSHPGCKRKGRGGVYSFLSGRFEAMPYEEAMSAFRGVVEVLDKIGSYSDIDPYALSPDLTWDQLPPCKQ